MTLTAHQQNKQQCVCETDSERERKGMQEKNK